MSKFSGKCDVYDCYGGVDVTEYNFFILDNPVPLRIDNQKDLAAYYPFLVVMSGGKTVRLSTDSYIDREEADWLESYLESMKRVDRRFKRKKETPTLSDFEKTYFGDFSPKPKHITELANRVFVDGQHATTEGIHDQVHDYMRKEWFNEMVHLGWDEDVAKLWIYGYRDAWAV